MTTKTVKRHYCDFCRRGFFKGKSALEHEAICCKNPKRHCYLCNSSRDVAVLVLEFNTSGLRSLIQSADGCPACILSGILQSKTDEFVDWDYKKAVSEWHAARDPYPGM